MNPVRQKAPATLTALILMGTMMANTNHAMEKAQPNKFLCYVGTYTGGESKGIYRFLLDRTTGEVSEPQVTTGVVNPSFLAIHPSQRYLYAVSEIEDMDGRKTGGVTAFAIDPETGELHKLNQQPSEGAGPCHLVVDKAGKNVLVANYGGGSVAVIPIQEDGSLAEPSAAIQHEGSSVNKRRQEKPHAHSVNLDSENNFAFVADLGLDKVMIYRFDPEKGSLEANDPAYAKTHPGAGPRHFAFHPDGNYAYVINELDCTVTAMEYDAKTGTLTPIQTISTLPADTKFEDRFSTAEVVAHPSGKLLFGSNRGHHSIARFTIDPQSGKLSFLGTTPTQGETPRNFAIDPTGTILLAENQDTGNIVLFRIDAATGNLTPTGTSLEIPRPVCIRMIPWEE